MNKELFQELETILYQYTSGNINYEFLKHISKSDNFTFENQNCILFSNLNHEFVKPGDYNNFYIYNNILNNPLDYVEWCKNNFLSKNIKFDLILNILSPTLFQNEDLINFICNNPSKLGIIALDNSCLEPVKKLLITIESQNNKSTVQRFNNFPDLHSICNKLEDFKNITISTENITIEYSKLSSLLNEDWLFNNQHFQNLSSLDSKFLKEEFILELKFIVITAVKIN